LTKAAEQLAESTQSSESSQASKAALSTSAPLQLDSFRSSRFNSALLGGADTLDAIGKRLGRIRKIGITPQSGKCRTASPATTDSATSTRAPVSPTCLLGNRGAGQQQAASDASDWQGFASETKRTRGVEIFEELGHSRGLGMNFFGTDKGIRG
jgi:hypothetical protein